MSEKMTLVLAEDERAAIADELRRYGNYWERVGTELWDSQVLPEPGEPDPPGITRQVEEMTGSHFAIAEECQSLAAAFEGDEPIPFTRLEINLVEGALDEAYIGELPPEVARTAMFCRIASRRLTDSDPGNPSEIFAVGTRPQPPATEGVATSNLLHVFTEVDANNLRLRKQIADQIKRVTALGIRMKAQVDETERLHGQGWNQSRRLTKQFKTFGVTDSSPRPTQRGIGL